MKPLRLISRASSAIAFLGLSACASLDVIKPQSPVMQGRADVTPVMTEHSFGLQCLGALIEESGASPIVIEVGTIRDRTIPFRLNDPSRLSQASEWLVITAISKLETPLVRSTRRDDHDGLAMSPAFRIDGAWTQDDELLRQSSGLGAIGWSNGGFRLGANRRFDYIAGDFVSEHNGIIEFSTAIGVFVGADRFDAKLLVEDGSRSAEIGFDARWADGPQLAQRRIAEAATLIHVARHFDIDYRPCLENGIGDPAKYRASLERYAAMNERDRSFAVQSSLSELGFDAGGIDGIWGPQSRRALMTYQSERGIPVTGSVSPAVFALLKSDRRREWQRNPHAEG